MVAMRRRPIAPPSLVGLWIFIVFAPPRPMARDAKVWQAASGP